MPANVNDTSDCPGAWGRLHFGAAVVVVVARVVDGVPTVVVVVGWAGVALSEAVVHAATNSTPTDQIKIVVARRGRIAVRLRADLARPAGGCTRSMRADGTLLCISSEPRGGRA